MLLRYAASFQTTKNCADALIDQRDQAEVTLLDAAVFVGCNPEEQLNRQPLPIQQRFSLLPFAHQTVPQRNVFVFGKRSRRVELHLIERIRIVERTVVGRMRFHERNHQNERIALMFLDEVARVFLEKLWPRQLDRQIADGYFRESSVRFVWRNAF